MTFFHIVPGPLDDFPPTMMVVRLVSTLSPRGPTRPPNINHLRSSIVVPLAERKCIDIPVQANAYSLYHLKRSLQPRRSLSKVVRAAFLALSNP